MHWSDPLDRLAKSYHDDKEGPDADLTRKVGRATIGTVAGAAAAATTHSHVAGVAASEAAKAATSDAVAHDVGSEVRTIAIASVGSVVVGVAAIIAVPAIVAVELGRRGLKKLGL
jgi:hypothetical protein